MWIAVNTHPNAEPQAILNLERQEYRCYCPTIEVQRRHARKVETVRRPFFPGYLFVDVDSRKGVWRPIMSTIGVRAVVRFGEKLGVVPPALVETLQRREADGDLRAHDIRDRFCAGQQVRFDGTPFHDLVGRIVAIDAKDRIWVLLDLLQRSVKVVAKPQNLVAA
ncbi:MAG: transcription termination/antitermination protein NusG [Alphaproteobacteria bacterium]